MTCNTDPTPPSLPERIRASVEGSILAAVEARLDDVTADTDEAVRAYVDAVVRKALAVLKSPAVPDTSRVDEAYFREVSEEARTEFTLPPLGTLVPITPQGMADLRDAGPYSHIMDSVAYVRDGITTAPKRPAKAKASPTEGYPPVPVGAAEEGRTERKARAVPVHSLDGLPPLAPRIDPEPEPEEDAVLEPDEDAEDEVARALAFLRDSREPIAQQELIARLDVSQREWDRIRQRLRLVADCTPGRGRGRMTMWAVRS